MRDIRKYEVFQLADQLVLEVYRVTVKFPKSEIFGLTGQTRRGGIIKRCGIREERCLLSYVQ